MFGCCCCCCPKQQQRGETNHYYYYYYYLMFLAYQFWKLLGEHFERFKVYRQYKTSGVAVRGVFLRHHTLLHRFHVQHTEIGAGLINTFSFAYLAPSDNDDDDDIGRLVLYIRRCVPGGGYNSRVADVVVV